MTVRAKTRTDKFDASEHLDNQETIAAFLEAALEDGNASVMAAALGAVAKARGMSYVA